MDLAVKFSGRPGWEGAQVCSAEKAEYLRALAAPPQSSDLEVRELAPGVFLIVEPGRIQSWPEFCASVPPHSVALDGRVAGPHGFDLERKIWNFDHHAGCDRVTTESTCKQVYEAIMVDGLIEKLGAENGSPRVLIHVKEPDPDVAFAVCALKNHALLQAEPVRERLLPLLDLEDLLDRRCGVLRRDPADRDLQRLAWVCEPYEAARMQSQGVFLKNSAAEMATVVEAVVSRLEHFLSPRANGERRALDMRYKEWGGGHKWSLVEEEGFYARVALANLCNGHTQDGVISVRSAGEECFSYVLMKTGSFSAFPVAALGQIFNALEGLGPTAPYRWGGDSFVVGSPYRIGSRLSPERVQILTNAFLDLLAGRPASPALVEQFLMPLLPERYSGQNVSFESSCL